MIQVSAVRYSLFVGCGTVLHQLLPSSVAHYYLFVVDVSALEKAGFMYLGAKSKKGYPVLYIVINRYGFVVL